MSSRHSDRTIIVGGGVIGLSLAWELARRRQAVTLLDAGQIGGGASWAGAGILPPTARQGTRDPYELLRAFSHDLHRQWAQELRDQTGIDTGYRRCGGIYLARSPGEQATLLAGEAWSQEHGIEYERWSREELHQREPRLAAELASGIRDAWYFPDECQLRNPRHLKALAAACRQQHVHILEGTVFKGCQVQNGRVVSVRTNRGELSAKHACLCSGAWARQTLDQLGVANGMLPIRGQMVLYACETPPLTHVVNEGHRYLVPRDDGRVLAGSVEEEVGFEIETTQTAIAGIRDWAEQILPELRRAQIEKRWAGLRPGSYDGFPYLGLVPGHENLWMAAGHFRSGLHLSCATAVVMANLMLHVPNDIDLHPFRVSRG